MEIAWLQTQYVVAIIGGLVGIAVTVVAQRILSKRGLFTYSVRHDRVAVSGDDEVLGSVRVTWNDNPMTNLYSSTVELVNDSLKDFANVEVRVFSTDTILLTERSEIAGTTRCPLWTEDYARALFVPPGEQATPQQIDAYSRGRSYLIPTMNRGQVVRFSYLNTARTDQPPTIWLDVLHKGVKLRFRIRHIEFFGVPQPQAAVVGAIIGLVIVGVLVLNVQSVWVAAAIAFVIGLIAQVPGAIAIGTWRWLRARLAD